MESIIEICKQYGIINYTINPDGSIDVNGSVYLYGKGLTELPLTFNRVTGYFICSNNQLTSLKGSPRWVGGYFSCNNNKLTSLEFSPDYVGGDFYCTGNKLTSLEFSPDYVGDDFNCNWNKLTDNYCDSEISGLFYTSLNQDGLTEYNYNEWRKMYKRKKILNDIFDM
jgi:hypothetical protein